jgi:Predicted Zn-dependent proteases and their inactivated homologs
MAVDHIISNAELTQLVSNMLNSAMLQNGVTAAAVGGSANVGLSARVRLGEVETIEFFRDKSLSLTVYKGQCIGSASITDLTPPAIAAAINAACRIADYTEADPYSGLADKQELATAIPDLDLYHAAQISPEQAIINARQCEAAALGYDKEIVNSEGAVFSTSDQLYVYANSNEFLAAYPTTRYGAYCTVIGQRGDNMQRDYEYTAARDISDLNNLEQVGKIAAQKTIARLGARKINTCMAPILLIPTMASSFWGTLIAAISGSNLYRKSSFLLDHLQQRVFPDFVNISEQPYILKALGSAPFDNEGVATRDKDIIKNGILNTYLLGSYAARRLGMVTTGNAGGVHNLVITPGEYNFTQLLQELGTGLVVTELLGHGTNMITGDYSQGAAGLWVEDGVIAYPVEEITIAGNFKDMFANIRAIGNDVDHRSNIITGSVLLDKLTIAGN